MLQIREDRTRGGRCSADVPYAHTAVTAAADDLRIIRGIQLQSDKKVLVAREVAIAEQCQWNGGRSHVLRMHLAPAAIEYGVISWEHRLVSATSELLASAKRFCPMRT